MRSPADLFVGSSMSRLAALGSGLLLGAGLGIIIPECAFFNLLSLSILDASILEA